ncbi:MAG: DUF4286 family protein [Duncaniella sp.]|nr:DUF4286 family protein [Duncaniella sp.]
MKYILNTTFHVLSSLEEEMLAWMKEKYVGRALEQGIFSNPQIARVMTQVEDNAESFAVQLATTDIVRGNEWLASDAFRLLEELRSKHGENVLFFSTWLEVIS